MTDKHKKKIVILAAGSLDAFTAKTAAGIVRYRPDEVVGVLDPSHAGERLEELLGVGEGIPIVSSLDKLDHLHPDTLVIGVATPGGRLPDEWRPILRGALERRMQIVNGLHTMLGENAELAELAARNGATIWDVRRPPEDLSVGMARAAQVNGHTVLTVGSDCNVGKKIVAIELSRELTSRGQDAVFVPTGQTGVMIAGRGIAIDRVIADFVSGAVEQIVMEQRDHDWIVIEGQGGIFHPAYSGVTLGLMHGACAGAMILCHQPTRSCLRHTQIPIPSLKELIAVHETLMRPVRPSRVVAIALNCLDLSEADATQAVYRAEQECQLPATDVVRFGAGPLADALVNHFVRTAQPTS